MMPPLEILLVEDNPVNQKVAQRLLEKAGHSVTIAGNGREALAWLVSQPFDLVLMDVQMPEMDGLEATTAIRQRERETGQHLPIVALTAHAMKGDRERCLEAGMDAYVTKPVVQQVLFQVMADVLASGRRGAANPVEGRVDRDGIDTLRARSAAGGLADARRIEQVGPAAVGPASQAGRRVPREPTSKQRGP